MKKMKNTYFIQMEETQKDSRWSWVVCISSFFVQFVAFGFHNSLGTYFVALLDKYGKSEAQTAWIGSMAIGLTYILGPLAIYICSHFSCRVAACTGSILVMTSAFLASVISDMKWMYVAFSLLNGLGSSMLYFSSLVVLIEYFNKHLSLANGIVLSGSGIGTFCISLISQNIISTYGLSTCYKALSGIYSICFFAGLAFAPTHNCTKDIAARGKKVDLRGHESLISKLKKCFQIGEQWKNKGFIVWTGATAVVMFAYYIPCMYLISIAKNVGVPPSKGSLLIGFMAMSHTIGKILIGRLADHPRINRLSLLQIGLLVSAVANVLLPLAKSYSALVAYSFVQGFCDGSYGVMIGLVTHDIVGVRLMADAIGCLYLVVAVPMTLGPPVAGMIHDFVGSYHPVFFLSSGLVCTGICLMFAVPWLVPAPTLEDDKDELELYDQLSESFDDSEEHFDMSYVDEKKMANLFGKKKGRNLLLDMPSLRNSLVSTRASSFVLFSIVSEDQHRDISAYTSRQELSLLSGTNTPIKGTPSIRRRHFTDLESRTSMYSLRQSAISVAQSEQHLGQDNGETEHTGIPFESALETVQEAVELERKISCEEGGSSQGLLPAVEIVVEETTSASDVEHTDTTSDNQELSTDESDRCSCQTTDKPTDSNSRTTWTNSASNNSLKSSGTELSEATVDSGYGEETWRSTSEIDSSFTVQNFINNDQLCIDVIPRSMSCANVSVTVRPPSLAVSTSQDYIDQYEDEYQDCFCAKHKQPLSACSSMDYIDCERAEDLTKCSRKVHHQKSTSSSTEFIDVNKNEEGKYSCNYDYSEMDSDASYTKIETVKDETKLSESNSVGEANISNMETSNQVESPIKELAPRIDLSNIDILPISNINSTTNKDVLVGCEYTDDMYSAEVERALELAEEIQEYIIYDYGIFEQVKEFRETVV